MLILILLLGALRTPAPNGDIQPGHSHAWRQIPQLMCINRTQRRRINHQTALLTMKMHMLL